VLKPCEREWIVLKTTPYFFCLLQLKSSDDAQNVLSIRRIYMIFSTCDVLSSICSIGTIVLQINSTPSIPNYKTFWVFQIHNFLLCT